MRSIRTRRSVPALVAAGAIVLAACGGSDDSGSLPDTGAANASGDATDSAAAPVEPFELGATTPMHKAGDLYFGGQPDAEALKLAQERGIKTVVDFRFATGSITTMIKGRKLR